MTVTALIHHFMFIFIYIHEGIRLGVDAGLPLAGATNQTTFEILFPACEFHTVQQLHVHVELVAPP